VPTPGISFASNALSLHGSQSALAALKSNISHVGGSMWRPECGTAFAFASAFATASAFARGVGGLLLDVSGGTRVREKDVITRWIF
jgi:nitrate/nitrite transporter NarK